MTFSQLLRAHRIARGLSQRELAARAELSAREISDLEREIRRAPYLHTVNALASALGLTPMESDEFAASVGGTQPRGEAGAGESGLPLPLSSLVGREAELADLLALLSAPSGPRLLTLTGPPGVGKTRLAIEACRSLTASQTPRCVFVSVEEARSQIALLRQIATALGIEPLSRHEEFDAIATHLAEDRLLLVLDNMEQLVSAAGVAVRLLRRCPNLQVLATSRLPLRVAPESVLPVKPLAVPPAEAATDDIDQLFNYPGVKLFVDRAAGHGTGFRLTEANRAAVAEISRRLAGLPLAIEIAAAQTPLLSPDQLIAGLRMPLRFLTGGPSDLPQRQATLASAVEWSYKLLTEQQQLVLCALSVLRGSWTLEAAVDLFLQREAMRSGSNASVESLESDIEALVRHSLLIEEERSGRTFYRFFDVVADYGIAQLRSQDQFVPTCRSLLDSATAFAEAASANLLGPEALAWTGRVSSHSSVIRSALYRGLEVGAVEEACNILWLLRVWLDYGPIDWATTWIETVIDEGNVSDVCRARLNVLAGFQQILGQDRALAERQLQEGMALLSGPECAEEREAAIDLLQPVIRDYSLPELTQEADGMVEVLRGRGDATRLARALRGRGMRRLDRCEIDAADADRLEATAIEVDNNLIRPKYATLFTAGILIHRGDLEAAREALLNRILAYDEGPFSRLVSRLRAVLGHVARLQGDMKGAAAAFETAIKEGLATATLYPLPLAFDGVAWLAECAGRHTTAGRLLGAGETYDEPILCYTLFDSAGARERLKAEVSSALGEQFDAAYEKGRRLSLSQAKAEALEELERQR